MSYTKYDNGNNWLITNGNIEVQVKNNVVQEVKEIRGDSIYQIDFEELPEKDKKEIKSLF